MLLILGISSTAWGQYWDEFRAEGHKNSVKVFFDDSAKAKIITYEKVYQTNDIAQTWSALKTITGSGFPRFVDASKSSPKHFRLCDNKGKVWVTNDDFVTWNSYSTGAGAFSKIDFPSDDNGFGLRNGYLYKSSDGGQSWAYLGGLSNDKIGGMVFINPTTGFVHINDDIGTDTILYKTTDGGSTWSPILFAGFQDSTENSWPSVTFFKSDGNRIVLGYENGKLLKSEDNGSNWTFISTPTYKDILAVDFYDANIGIIGMEDGHTLETKDGGKTFRGMDCKNAINGYSSFEILTPHKYFQMAPGNRHGLYTGRTDATFDEWVVIAEGGTERYESVKYAAKDVLYAYSAGKVWRSTDNGSTWNSKSASVGGFMAPADANTCFFAMEKWPSGATIKKVSGGLSQVTDVLIPNTDTLGIPTMLKFLTPKLGYFSFQDKATGNITLYKTIDGGGSWKTVSLDLPFSSPTNDTFTYIDEIQFFDTNQTKGVMVGKGKIGFQYIGWVGFTSDGGSTWTYELKFGVGQKSPFHGVRSLGGDVFGVVAGQNSYNLWSGGQSNRSNNLPIVFSNENVVHNRTSTDDGTGNVNNDPFSHHAIPTIRFPEPRSMDVYAGKDTNWIVGVGHEGLIYRMFYYGTGAMPWQVPGINTSASSGGGSVPAAPSNVTLLNIRRTDQVVNITWEDNSNDEDGFRVYRSTDGVNFTVVQTLSQDQLTTNDSFLNDASDYYYKLTAFNAHGESDFSNTVQIKTLTNIKDLNKELVGFYPNPVGENMFVFGDVSLVRIFNLHGEMVLESNSKSINLSLLNKGIYLVELNSGNKRTTMRMVK